MTTQEKVNELQSICEQIQALEKRKHEFISRFEWGTVTFESGKDDMETAFWLANTIAKLPICLLSEGVIQNAISSLSNIKDAFGAIDTFTISRDDTQSQKVQIINQLKQEIEGVMSNLGIWLPVQILRASETENRVAKMKGIEAEMDEIHQNATRHYETRKKEIDEAAQAARTAAGKAGAAEFTQGFRDEAMNVEKRARRWLWPTGIFATLALFLALALAIPTILPMFGILDEVPANAWEAVYRLGGRVITIMVLFYAAVWSGRIFLANMHLASVNKHRAVSLQTLQAFHHAAEDAVAKDAVVLEAARAVYENVPSGYIGRQATEHDASTRVVEFIKNANKAPQTGD